MQSFLQYRRFKRSLEEQIQRHGTNRAAGVAVHEQQESPTPRKAGYLPAHIPAAAGQLADCDKEVDGSKRDQRVTRSQVVTPHIDSSVADTQRLDDNGSEKISRASETLANAEDASLSARAMYAYDQVTVPATTPVDPTAVQNDEQAADPLESTTAASSAISLGAVNEVQLKNDKSDKLRPMGTQLGQAMTGVSLQTRDKEDVEELKSHVFIVGFQGDRDPFNPHNWTTTRRLIYTFIIASIGFIVGLASSIDSAAIPQAAQEFGVSEVVESLATALYLVGFGCGAFLAAPLSETVGRNPVYLTTGVLYMIFVMASGLAPNIGAQLAFRFLAGFFGSTPLTCAGGSISDLWNAEERTVFFPVFANSAFWGPALGPLIGGFIAESSIVSWRWCEWITLIWSALIFGTVFLFMPETYGPVLLKWKAENLRRLTGDERYMSALEAEDTKFTDRVLHNLYRPWLIMALEPIAILFTIYLSIVYIVFFTFLTGYEFIFEETYHLSQGLTFTIFIALALGFLCGSTMIPYVVKGYNRKLQQAKSEGKTSLPPEQRLVLAMFGAPLLPIGLFWMAWTSYPSISIWSPILANLPAGFAIIAIFISTYQYLIDAFERHAASALVGLTFVRYVVAGGMIPVSIPFYKNLGVHWTLTILGALAAIMAPVPYIFYCFGAHVRAKSKYAVR